MILNKFAKVGMVLIISAAMLTGCTSAIGTEGGQKIDDGGLVPGSEVGTELTMPEFDIIGEVIEIDGNSVHIIFGDVVEIFEVINAETAYLGQTVEVLQEDGLNTLEPYLTQNFEFKHTNMGDIIQTATGTVVSFGEGKLKIKNDDGEFEFSTYSDLYIQEGDLVDVEYVKYGARIEDMTALQVLPLASAMEITIEELNRADNGMLIAFGADEDGMESHVSITPGSNDNFNLTELKVGDRIEIIPAEIMESYPMQVNPMRVRVVESF